MEQKQYLRVLNFCKVYYDQNQRFPILSETAAHFGISREAVRQQMARLTSKGYLIKHGKKNRGYDLTNKAYEIVKIVFNN